jgi:hypothetical protein
VTTSNFPLGLDNLINPAGNDHLDGPSGTTHADQHINANDSIEALQTRVGVTGSNVPSTIDYELHNINHGHDHDGTNSRPVKLGTSGSVTGSGYFNISPSSSMGETVFNINIALLDLSSSIASIALSSSNIAFESQTVELTPSAVRVNLTGSGVSGSVSGGNYVTYNIPGIDYRQTQILNDGGPFEPFGGTSLYQSCSLGPYPFVSYSCWYTDSTKTKKIYDVEYANRNSRKQAEKITYKTYFEDGVTVKSTTIDIITYVSVFEATRIRTVI